MSVQLNHHIVWSRDQKKEAAFLTDILGLKPATKIKRRRSASQVHECRRYPPYYALAAAKEPPASDRIGADPVRRAGRPGDRLFERQRGSREPLGDQPTNR